MDSALWVSKTGVEAQQRRMTSISNNLANVNTTGYKRSMVVFEDLLYQNLRQAGGQTSQDAQLPSGLYLGTGVRVVATEKQHTQGNLIKTDGALDTAIEGRGFFQVLLPDGSLAYSRDGGFQVDANGALVTANGMQVQPSITIPSDAQNISIGTDGSVSATSPGTATPTAVGSLQLVDFQNATGLQPIGKNLYIETAASGTPQIGTPGQNGLGSLTQGFLESSNVNVVEELVGMIEAQRAYEMNAKAIQATDSMLRYVTNNL